jgi:hypothetical protein
VIRAEREVTSLSEVDIFSLASFYHGELKSTPGFASQKTEGVTHIGWL